MFKTYFLVVEEISLPLELKPVLKCYSDGEIAQNAQLLLNVARRIQ
jgi:hypothetical protein